jgi:hypothetical protein
LFSGYGKNGLLKNAILNYGFTGLSNIERLTDPPAHEIYSN